MKICVDHTIRLIEMAEPLRDHPVGHTLSSKYVPSSRSSSRALPCLVAPSSRAGRSSDQVPAACTALARPTSSGVLTILPWVRQTLVDSQNSSEFRMGCLATASDGRASPMGRYVCIVVLASRGWASRSVFSPMILVRILPGLRSQ